MSGHTPGPWRFETNHPDIVVWAGKDEYDPDDEHVASVYGDGSVENSEANARLIAAAPDLLAACRAFVRVREEQVVGNWYNIDSTEQNRDDAFYDAQAAIAKAEGR